MLLLDWQILGMLHVKLLLKWHILGCQGLWKLGLMLLLGWGKLDEVLLLCDTVHANSINDFPWRAIPYFYCVLLLLVVVLLLLVAVLLLLVVVLLLLVVVLLSSSGCSASPLGGCVTSLGHFASLSLSFRLLGSWRAGYTHLHKWFFIDQGKQEMKCFFWPEGNDGLYWVKDSWMLCFFLKRWVC